MLTWGEGGGWGGGLWGSIVQSMASSDGRFLSKICGFLPKNVLGFRLPIIKIHTGGFEEHIC